MKSPGAYLSMIERGLRPIPHVVLQNIPKVYGISSEEVLMKAYWPQLQFPLLDAVMAPDISAKAVKDYLGKMEKQLNEEEKRELTRYAGFLMMRRYVDVER